jgi:hypothetical protein
MRLFLAEHQDGPLLWARQSQFGSGNADDTINAATQTMGVEVYSDGGVTTPHRLGF